MSENTIESYGKGFLVILLPISFLIIFLVATWKIWLAVVLLVLAFNIWQYYRWQHWCVQVNPIFNQLIRENQGRITPIDLAIKGNFPGEKAKRYLDGKAMEFGARTLDSEDGSEVYYFITASTLGSILDSSEPPKQLSSQRDTTATLPLLTPPQPKNQQEPQTESKLQPNQEEIKQPSEQQLQPTHKEIKQPSEQQPQPTHEEVKRPLEKQLLFGSLIQSELAKRLSVYSSTVYKRREDPDFPEWSRSRDPDGIAWTYSKKTKEFFPIEEKDKT